VALARARSNPWCSENYIQGRAMRRAQDVRKQLLGIMDRCGPSLFPLVGVLSSHDRD